MQQAPQSADTQRMLVLMYTKTPSLGRRFPGQYFDGESGTHYNFHRDYDPITGRYIQSDKLDVMHRSNSPMLAMAAGAGVISLPNGEVEAVVLEDVGFGNNAAVPPNKVLNNLYGYASQNSISDTDMYGLHPASAALAIALAAAKAAKKKIEEGANYCKSIRCKIENHDVHHHFGFPFNERRNHIQLTCWRKGIKGSTFIIRFPY